MAGHKTIITCAVTGAGAYTDKMKAVPVTPVQIADECISAAAAGAAICHIHVRDLDHGGTSMDLDLYREVVGLLRARGTDLVLNLTTGAGARYIPSVEDPLKPGPGSTLATPEVRVRHVVELRPEICSLDIATMNFGAHSILNTPTHLREMGAAIRAAGVKPELEVFDIGHIDLAKKLIAEGVLDEPPFFQICLGVPGGSPATPEALLALKQFLPKNAVWGGFGVGASSFPMVAQCVLAGGHARVGLEDNLYMSRGVLASGNAQLVERAVHIVELLGGAIASPSEARQMLGLSNAAEVSDVVRF